MLIIWYIFCFLVLKILSGPTGRQKCNTYDIFLHIDSWHLLTIGPDRVACVWWSTGGSRVNWCINNRDTCTSRGFLPSPAVPWHNLGAVLSCLAQTLIASPKLNLWTPRGYAQAKDHWAFKDQEDVAEEGWLAFRPTISFRHSLVLTECLKILCRISA